jgi:hypothetical protein
MVFNKNKCENCDSKIKGKFSFCPYCGDSLVDEDQMEKDYGLIGKDDALGSPEETQMDFGITDKLIGSLVNSLIKNLDKQFKNLDKQPKNFENAEVQNFPNGIKIRIGHSPEKAKKQKNFFKKQLSDQQLKKMSTLPRTEAKTKVKRIGEKVIYELNAPGIESPQDVFVSKLESGYEIKAISERKIYVNTLPINLPMRGFAIDKNKLFIEFKPQNQPE